jgi:hypothetical protein
MKNWPSGRLGMTLFAGYLEKINPKKKGKINHCWQIIKKLLGGAS